MPPCSPWAVRYRDCLRLGTTGGRRVMRLVIFTRSFARRLSGVRMSANPVTPGLSSLNRPNSSRTGLDKVGEQVAILPCAIANVESAFCGLPRRCGKALFSSGIESPFDTAREVVCGSDRSEIAIALMLDRVGNSARRERDHRGRATERFEDDVGKIVFERGRDQHVGGSIEFCKPELIVDPSHMKDLQSADVLSGMLFAAEDDRERAAVCWAACEQF